MKNYINKLIGKVKLFKEFVTTTPIYKYREWQEDDNKSLFVYSVEWFFENVVSYLMIGLLLALAFVTEGFIGLVLKFTLGYYFLKRLLLLIRVGK